MRSHHVSGSFPRSYERYLDVVYDRKQLIDSVAEELATRGVVSLLDCAAGTGFPAIDLAERPLGLTVHCSDASQTMLEELLRQAGARGLEANDLAPPGPDERVSPIDRMQLDWNDLDTVEQTYDYVMCRGNSLVYDKSWNGSSRPLSPSPASDVLNGIASMARRVRPGGYLHIDAPRRLGEWHPDRQERDETVVGERVDLVAARRRWTFHVRADDEPDHCYTRYSARVTIDNVAEKLETLGFLDLDPVELEGERPGFGVIIARKPV